MRRGLILNTTIVYPETQKGSENALGDCRRTRAIAATRLEFVIRLVAKLGVRKAGLLRRQVAEREG